MGSFAGRSLRGASPLFSCGAGREFRRLVDFFCFEFGGDRAFNVL